MSACEVYFFIEGKYCRRVGHRHNLLIYLKGLRPQHFDLFIQTVLQTLKYFRNACFGPAIAANSGSVWGRTLRLFGVCGRPGTTQLLGWREKENTTAAPPWARLRAFNRYTSFIVASNSSNSQTPMSLTVFVVQLLSYVCLCSSTVGLWPFLYFYIMF